MEAAGGSVTTVGPPTVFRMKQAWPTQVIERSRSWAEAEYEKRARVSKKAPRMLKSPGVESTRPCGMTACKLAYASSTNGRFRTLENTVRSQYNFRGLELARPGTPCDNGH